MATEKNLKKQEKYLLALEKSKEKELLKAFVKSNAKIKADIALLSENGTLTGVEIMRYNRLVELQNKVIIEIKTLAKETGLIINNSVIEQYQEGYNTTSFLLEKDIEADMSFSLIPKYEAKEAIINPLSKVGFVQRNTTNLAKTAMDLNSLLAQGIIQGKSYKDIADIVNDKFNIGYQNSLRIVETENHRVNQKASEDSANFVANKGVIMQKQWRASIDASTRETHGEADGQIVDLDKPFIVQGENLMYPGDPAGSASNVINCRCVSIKLVSGYKPSFRRIRGEGIVPYTNYTDWKENHNLPVRS